MENFKNWYVVCTKPRYERKVVESLERKKMLYYYPQYNPVNYSQDKRKVVSAPLFKSMLFVYSNEKEHSIIKQIDGITGILYWLQKPATIKEEDLIMLKNFIEHNSNVRVEKTNIISDQENETSDASQKKIGNIIDISNVNRISLPSLGYILVSESVLGDVKIVA